MTRTAVAIRHLAFEDLGLLGPLLSGHGFAISYVEATTAGAGEWSEAADADLLIVLGGPIGVADTDDYPFLRTELEILRARLEASLPTLGICLGAQLMALALDGDVRPGRAAEIGYAPVTLTAAGKRSVLRALAGAPVLHWHGDVISTPAQLPPLASTPACENQAFTSGTNALALQFHLEADSVSLERWLVGHAYELGARGISIRELREDAARYGARLASQATTVFSDWLSGLTFRDGCA